jgi:hypothetical protein
MISGALSQLAFYGMSEASMKSSEEDTNFIKKYTKTLPRVSKKKFYKKY